MTARQIPGPKSVSQQWSWGSNSTSPSLKVNIQYPSPVHTQHLIRHGSKAEVCEDPGASGLSSRVMPSIFHFLSSSLLCGLHSQCTCKSILVQGTSEWHSHLYLHQLYIFVTHLSYGFHPAPDPTPASLPSSRIQGLSDLSPHCFSEGST